MSMYLQQENTNNSLKRINIICSLAESTGFAILCIGCRNTDILTKKLREKNIHIKTLDITGNTDITYDLNNGIPFKSNTFDCIIAGEIIEHLYDTDFILKEIHRVLAEKGFLVLSVPNICSLRSRVKMIFGKLPVACAKSEHIRDFNFDLIKKFVEKNGFDINIKKSDGVWVRDINMLPSTLSTVTIGEHIILKCMKK